MTPSLLWALGLPPPPVGSGAVLQSYHSNNKTLILSCVFCIFCVQETLAAVGVVRPSDGLQPHLGSLSPVLADLVPHLPDFLMQPHGSLDLQEAHGGLQLGHVRPGWLLLEPAHGHFQRQYICTFYAFFFTKPQLK